MASNVIMIGSTPRLAGEVRNAVDSLQASVNRIREIHAMMSEFAGDDAALAAQLGLAGETAATDAATVRGNFVNAIAVLNGADIAYFLNRMS